MDSWMEGQLYGVTTLDMPTVLDDFPVELYDESPISDGPLEALDCELLSPKEWSEETLFHQDQTSPHHGDFVDPDTFLNGVVKRDSESEQSNMSLRNTPSPSDSHKSFESYPSSGYGSSSSARLDNTPFDVSPISSEYFLNPLEVVDIPGPNVIRVGAAHPPTVRKVSCQSNLSDLRKVKLPPKGTNNANKHLMKSKTITKRTIILTAKDYNALIHNIKNQTTAGPVLIKTTVAPTINMDKPVLPKAGGNSSPSQVQSASSAAAMVQDSIAESTQSPAAPLMAPMMSPTSNQVDERAFKRHQRMIKNRESAYLSRVRKKEYVTSLEQEIDSLKSENLFLKNENSKLLEKLKLKCSCGKPYLNIESISKQLTPNVRKNTAIILAMLFMVSINIGPLGSLLTARNNKVSLDKPIASTHHKRSLLWLDDSNLSNRRKLDISLNMTDLDDDLSRTSDAIFPVCPFYVNQTENIRLASELRRWIGENGYKNLTDRDGDDMSINSFSEMFALKDTIDSMYQQMKDISSQMQTFQKRSKLTVPKKRQQSKSKKVRDLQLYQQQKEQKQNDLAFYYAGFNRKYAKFFEEIGRRDDTFYLVSFSGEHLLLPALAHNKTNRPKMSLMLPAMMENATHPSDKVTLMQIDCEVMNTSMIQIREKTIPGDLLRSHGKPDAEDDFSRQDTNRTSRASEFNERPERNITRDTTAKVNRKLHKHAAVRPFFVQRMTAHVKEELELN
ncbi:cyclic AMP-dependent transcription factor ATF-6 alpha [Toxorhynchites rutilus septentrionalis]|uniref:cyclic AMP-dependent transcription factor ATF-6 alpha n=1 Tax=Toxorhynchites rutilus septentrionalis TaxID=329112 RepID=UPI00247AAE1B|nr:cyclic AMP-dependent transcription factor ATF-6 alpha [Toxorhynchites rutilus septentrionalis]